jgi:acyl carrier protein
MEHGYLGRSHGRCRWGEGGCLGRAMEEKDVFYLVKKIVVAQPGVAPDTVTMATSFTKDLGADPIAVIELEFALREEFGIEIPDVDAEKIPTVGEAVSYTRPLVEGGCGGAMKYTVRPLRERCMDIRDQQRVLRSVL